MSYILLGIRNSNSGKNWSYKTIFKHWKQKKCSKKCFSWFRINNGTPKFLCCLVNHQEMSHNFVKLHFRDAPHPVSYEYMWWQKLYANRALLSPCHLIFNFLLKIASDSHQVQWGDSSKPRNDAKNLTLLNISFNVIKVGHLLSEPGFDPHSTPWFRRIFSDVQFM